jgi:hypothetical protein
MTQQEALRSIDTALKQHGFKRDWSQSAHPRYRGRLDRSGLNVPVSVEIPDLDFVHPPIVRLECEQAAAGKRVPHLTGADNQLCYIERNSTVLDRYDPGGTVLRCLVQAEKVLGDGLRGRLHADFAAEFANYWSRSPLLVDLPPAFTGLGSIYWVALNPDDKREIAILTRKDKLARAFRDAHARSRGAKAKPIAELCIVANTIDNLGLNPEVSWSPRTLKSLLAFFRGIGGTAATAVETILREGEGLNRWVAVRAPNAFCLAEIKIPKAYNKPEFMTSRKRNLPETLAQIASSIPIERYIGFPVDAKYLYERNLGDLPSLAGKKVMLIGCGTIGGFLAVQLAQSGAGSQGGRLVLVDEDLLMPSNLGRHALGVQYLNCNKAEACTDFISHQLPFLDVEARPVDVLTILPSLSDFDLVIDATGEEALSIAINEYAVRKRPNFPPTIHVWIVGNGGAAQALLCDGSDHACLKCQKPQLAGPPRHRTLRPDANADLRRNAACGDGLYAPFPVSRSRATAALALELALAWNCGDAGHRFRTRIFDPAQCFQVKDTTDFPTSGCPACGSRPA